MNYTEALAWVHSLDRMGKKAGLGRMRALLAALGDPQRRLRFVHVAGTNGKGSVVSMSASILKEAGYTVGANLSPYVVDFRERFMLNGEMIAQEALAQLMTEVRRVIEAQRQPAIEFEVVTAAALLWFAQSGCDIVCLEAGIGGRLDATNVIEETLVACITRIGFDHTEILGDTLAKIAAEKCGIMREGRPVVSYTGQPREAAEEIMLRAGKLGAPLIVPSPEDFHFYKAVPGRGALLQNRVNYGGYELDIPLPGRHQGYNAAMALEAALALWRQGFKIEDAHIIDGIRKARLPARIEVLRRAPLILLDGAHNEDGARALAATLAEAKLKDLVAVCGVLRDKNADKMVRLLAPHLKAMYTVAPDSPRAMPAEELAALAGRFIGQVEPCADAGQAIARARAQEGRGMLVFGSLYLASQARGLLKEDGTKIP